ncbi:HTH_38 domain-containing protein [Trichonephila clavipes]|nr:HTH_38 domain-containing protein [Trichonephila clavipes]
MVAGYQTTVYLCLVKDIEPTCFDQVSDFDRGRIVAYRDCGLSFREIGQRVRQNQATVMRICHRWMQEEVTDRQGRSHPPRCTIVRDDRRIVIYGSDGPCSHIANHSTTNLVHYASFGVRSYHSTPFAAEWNVRKASFASLTLE